MKRDKFFIYHQAFLKPLLTKVEGLGYSLERLTSKSMIKRFEIQDYQGYLPYAVVHEFLEVLTRKFSAETLQQDFYKEFPLVDLGPYGDLINGCPDFLSVLEKGLKYQHFFQTNQVMRLEIHGALSRFSHTHLDKPSPERCIAQKIGFSMIIRTFKSFLGEDWVPEIIQVPGKETKWLEGMFDQDTVEKIIWQINCPTYAFYFRTSSMACVNPATPLAPAQLRVMEQTHEKLGAVLNSQKAGTIPTLTDMSKYFEVSERTIVRKLHAEGKTYSKMLEQYLFKKSLELISDPRLKVGEISQILGYANPSNFNRAFRKWTNATPNTYRAQALNLH